MYKHFKSHYRNEPLELTNVKESSVATENVIPTENVIHYIFGYYIFGYDRLTENVLVITENVISLIIK